MSVEREACGVCDTVSHTQSILHAGVDNNNEQLGLGAGRLRKPEHLTSNSCDTGVSSDSEVEFFTAEKRRRHRIACSSGLGDDECQCENDVDQEYSTSSSRESSAELDPESDHHVTSKNRCRDNTGEGRRHTRTGRANESESSKELSPSENAASCVDSSSETRHIRQHSSSSMSELEESISELEISENGDAAKARGITRGISRQSSRDHGRTKSLYGASPNCKFGPKASLMKNQANILTIQDPGSQRLNWYKPPLSVLIIKKIYDDSVLHPFVQLATWLIKERQMVVHVESTVQEDPLLDNFTHFSDIRHKLCTFKMGEDDLTDKIDLIITLGGDGTLLYASSLFQQSVPPVMAFHLGSLGFLSPFEFDLTFKDRVKGVLEGNAPLILRHRLKAAVSKQGSEVSDLKTTEGKQNILCLNEVVVDRGPSAYLCNLDLFIEHKYITSVQGDGLIISTPTGSTAYSAAAGASMVHPNVPAIIITPICPHSLSFRPIVVPAGVEIKIMLAPHARGAAMVSFDGRSRQEISQGDILRITTSIFPLPSLCQEDQISDWFDSLAGCLHWNVRKQQKALSYTPSSESLESTSDNGR